MLSDRTEDYLPKPAEDIVQKPFQAIQENVQKTFRGLGNTPANHQRPRSLPDTFRHVEDQENSRKGVKRKLDVGSFFSSLFKKSDRLSPNAYVTERERTASLPSYIRWVDETTLGNVQGNYGSIDHSELLSDLTVLSSDDWEDEFLLRRSTKQLEMPVTSCFTAKDLPLLDFEDIRSLDDDICSDTSTSCSYASPRSSEPYFEMDFNRTPAGRATDLHEGYGIDVEAAELSIKHKLRNLTTNDQMHFSNQYQNNGTDVVMDMDSEMDLVEEYISQHSN